MVFAECMVDKYLEMILKSHDCVPFWTHSIYNGTDNELSCTYQMLLDQYMVATKSIFSVRDKCKSKTPKPIIR